MRNVPSLAETDITVTNTRGAHATTIAEHTIGMLVFLARGFDALYDAQKEHVWAGRRGRPRTGLVGLTMGIIGLGNLGRAIAERAKAFDMKIIAVDAHAIPVPDYVAEFWQLDGLSNLLQKSDVVVVTVPITPETRGMLGPDELSQMKDGAFLLVVSRGGIIDEPTVIQMLKDGKLTACGLDVAATEPLPADDPLWDAPNIFITPHNSPSSTQTRNNVVSILKQNLTRYLNGEELFNIVDKKLGY
jgi:phosphoglycerate dehydrogenase-like enzyme